MVRHAEDGSREELYMGFRIHERKGIFIALPLDWCRGGEEAIVATDRETVRQEIRRWWYQVEA